MPQRAGAQGLRAGVGAVQTGDGVDGFARDLAFDLADPLDATDLCHGRPIESGDDLAADGDAADLDASQAPSRRSGRSHGPAVARPGREAGAAPGTPRAVPGGKASPKATARSAMSAGWLALTVNR